MSKTDWKSKATENAHDRKRLKKKIKELTKSRDDWKAKSFHHKSHANKLATDFKKLKTKLNDLADSP